MCIKEVQWDLQKADLFRRATILAISSLLRVEVIESSGVPHDVVDRPLDYTRDDLLRFYEQMEDIRNANTFQIEQTQKIMRRLGTELPEFSVQHAKNTGRGLEVWMCTVGAGINPDRRDAVREIWQFLSESREHLGNAIAGLREVEQLTANMTGMPPGGMFSSVNTEEWLEACRFVPSSFVKDLRL